MNVAILLLVASLLSAIFVIAAVMFSSEANRDAEAGRTYTGWRTQQPVERSPRDITAAVDPVVGDLR
jgi:hypothetical protein